MWNGTRRRWLVGAMAMLGLGGATGDRRAGPEDPPGGAAAGRGAPATPDGQFFAMKRLRAERERLGRPYHQFIDEPTMSMGVYHLPAGGTDHQKPHDLDEAYHVVAGRGRFTVGSETRPVAPGDVLFVRARAEHRFHDIVEDLTLLVFFTRAPIAG